MIKVYIIEIRDKGLHYIFMDPVSKQSNKGHGVYEITTAIYASSHIWRTHTVNSLMEDHNIKKIQDKNKTKKPKDLHKPLVATLS